MRLFRIVYYLAAALSILGALAHEILGAPKVLQPLAETDLPEDVIWLHHFSWHVGTVAVLGMATLFILAARRDEARPFGIVASSMSAGFAALELGLAQFGDAALWGTPAPYPWTVVALLGFVGVATTPTKR